MVVSNCATTGCPADLTFSIGGFDAGSPTLIESPGGVCGSGTVTADGAGNLYIRVGKQGDGGADSDVGLEFMIPAADGGSSDAATGGE
jgi:hypothetical protein